jgi:trehalose/maltose hydrolase-like predicted phosphorylase
MFPWESAFTGAEVTPTSADTGIYEQHISGDIAFAITQFWRLHRDVDWMQQNAFETLRGIAEFWVSRVEKLANGMYGILGVTGPDEYHVNIDNSVYTNVVAKMAIESALSIAAELNITSQIPSWSQWQSVAANMYIPFDFTKQIHLEYDGYAGQQIKQADVVLLGFPLGLAMAPQIRLNDLQYYAPRTDPYGLLFLSSITSRFSLLCV